MLKIEGMHAQCTLVIYERYSKPAEKLTETAL